MTSLATRIGVGVFDAVFRPSRLVGVSPERYVGKAGATPAASRLLAVYFVNILLYAVPLTAAGIGVRSGGTAPPWFADLVPPALGAPRPVWRLATALAQNSASLIAGTALTFATYHATVVVTLNSRGTLRSLHTVIYSTSAYLAGIFTVVWVLSTNPAVTVAREFVIGVQKRFIYACIDVLDADIGLPGGRPGDVSLAGASQVGTLTLAVLALLAAYYLYSLYLGARINHRTSRTAAAFTVLAVAVSPAIYVFGSILAATSI